MNKDTKPMNDSELYLTADKYRDEQSGQWLQVTASCKCGRGGWLRLQDYLSISQVKDLVPEKKGYKDGLLIKYNAHDDAYNQAIDQMNANINKAIGGSGE